MEFYTAPTYEGLEIREPFQENGKWYGYVSLKSNPNKKIRLYDKLQTKAGAAAPTKDTWNARKGFGFGDKGYITIFTNAANHEEFFEKYQYARFCVYWGWYVVSDEPLPKSLPGKVSAVHLSWYWVGNEDNTLKPKEEIFKAVQQAIKDPTYIYNSLMFD